MKPGPTAICRTWEKIEKILVYDALAVTYIDNGPTSLEVEVDIDMGAIGNTPAGGIGKRQFKSAN